MTKYWLTGTSLNNFNISKNIIGFEMECFQDRYENMTKKEFINHENYIIEYIWGCCKFGAVTQTIGTYKYDTSIKYEGTRNNPKETFPHCFYTLPILVPLGNQLLGAEKLVPYLSFVSVKQKTARKNGWKLAFMNAIMEIEDRKDFEYIVSAMKESDFYKEVNPY
jgi:hypothetical protein